MLRPFARGFKLICDFNITDQTYLSNPGDDYNGLFFCVLLKKPLNTLIIKRSIGIFFAARDLPHGME